MYRKHKITLKNSGFKPKYIPSKDELKEFQGMYNKRIPRRRNTTKSVIDKSVIPHENGQLKCTNSRPHSNRRKQR